jgi:hypothetical protein
MMNPVAAILKKRPELRSFGRYRADRSVSSTRFLLAGCCLYWYTNLSVVERAAGFGENQNTGDIPGLEETWAVNVGLPAC